MRVSRLAALAVVGVVLLSSCAANEMQDGGGAESLSGELNGSGASSQGSASDVWIAAFQTANPRVTINYSPDGSGAGRKAFISGGVAYAGSDSSLSSEELAGDFAACIPGTKAIDIPVYISPIALIFNIEGVAALKLDPAAIAGIFSGTITMWSDPAITALNPDAELPHAPITAVHRSDDSGTTKNFTDYLARTAPEVWDAPAADTFPYTGGEAAQGTSGVVGAVTNGHNTIGYADASRAGGLGVASLKVGDSYVDYSAAAAAQVVTGSPLVDGRSANDIAIALDRTTTDPTHYPLVLVSYLIVCQEYANPETGALVKAYAKYVASPAGQAEAAKSAGAAPLSAELSAKVATVIESIR
ncbi:MAG: phosphate ABC transporter substrate-binding protein PstS [Cryobacterium sp.]|nr:phosphate ABC transporter substrate-binding protein PstS [Cryobacterium sp.]